MTKIAVIRIRGLTKLRRDFTDTLTMLNLCQKNNCAVFENTSDIMGMIKKVKDFVTWGEISDDTLKLMEKRKKDKFYALHPPVKGFEKKGIKMPFSKGGALGYRGDKINDLLKRMV
ncbi:uL30 family ribosomal protein [Candidatus Woesearchaeota archaeon]|nr:uL30 family ribosomal protein [Candidatus Woesearchaeota archaeon]MBW2978873.1 uL30 family ribosomal protein [Candidatus Woesearchaeota archaeon]